jgi:sugar phosphate isomerase/epimerase
VVNGDERDPRRLAELLHRLCERGRRYGVRMNLEPTPWTGIPNLAAARAVVEACGHADARLMIDPIHLDRAGGTAADVAALPRPLLDYAQVCDAVGPRPADVETMIHQARHERALPGEGDLDLVGLLCALRSELPLSLEAPVESLARRLTPLERAQRALRSMQALLAAVAARRSGIAGAGPGVRVSPQ